MVCPRCDGACELPGKMPWDSTNCGYCRGAGKVLTAEAARFWRYQGFSTADAEDMAKQGVTLKTVEDYTPPEEA